MRHADSGEGRRPTLSDIPAGKKLLDSRGHRRPKPSEAFTLVEVVVAMTFLVFGLLALTSTSLAVHALKRSDGERHLAGEAIRSLTEEIGALAGEARTNPNGWSLTVAGAYGAPGDRFEVEGLTTLRGEPTVGTIEVITDERVTDADLGVPLGMPRDLDNDGFTNTADVSGTATVLPVLLRLRWTGVTGELEMVHGFYVTGI